jgi:hypothetical protein
MTLAALGLSVGCDGEKGMLLHPMKVGPATLIIAFFNVILFIICFYLYYNLATARQKQCRPQSRCSGVHKHYGYNTKIPNCGRIPKINGYTFLWLGGGRRTQEVLEEILYIR